MEGARERYYRSLRWREVDKLEEARVNFWTKIDAAINEAKSCESVANRDAEESRRERKLMNMELEGRIDTLLGGQRSIRQRLGEAEMERVDARDRAELLVMKVDNSEWVVI